jgi:hypothetical protein
MKKGVVGRTKLHAISMAWLDARNWELWRKDASYLSALYLENR